MLLLSEQNWYREKMNLPLEQGDILKKIDVVVPTYQLLKGQTDELPVATEDIIILTQSCDLAHSGKTNWVQVAKLIDIETLFGSLSNMSNKTKSQLNSIIKGYVPNYQMIEQCDVPGFEFPRKIVDFREVFNLPIEYVIEAATEQGSMVTLNSPYKEHLSQAYARFYMRVGLPTNIPLY